MQVTKKIIAFSWCNVYLQTLFNVAFTMPHYDYICINALWMRKCLVFIVILVVTAVTGIRSDAQVVYSPVSDYGITLFLDELASEKIITLNSAVKPYSRREIATHLVAALKAGDSLTARQMKELTFFIQIYSDDIGKLPEKTAIAEGAINNVPASKLKLLLNPAAAVWRDSLFTISVRPILGFSGGYNQTGKGITWRNGGEVSGSVAHWGFYAALRDNHQDPMLGRAVFLTQQPGGHIKALTDWSEMTGGITWAWRWGSIGLLKESPVWGTSNAGSNIFSGRAPSFMQVKLNIRPVKWLEMTYLHGWLTSMVVDSTRSYWVNNAYGTDYREVYHKKYIAASMFTLTPAPGLNISAGNSVIWSDPRITPYYIIPIFFYKSVDHAVNSGIDNSNSQMFLDISSRQIKHIHIYGTLFIDEMSTSRFKTSDYNFFSWKGGIRTGNIRPLQNLWLTAECTFTYPLAYQHYVPVLTFENQGYNLGHYLRDNTREWYFALDYKPARSMNIRLWYNRAERGEDFTSAGGSRIGLPYVNPVVWKSERAGVDVSWQVTGGVYLTAAFTASEVSGEESWTPLWEYGRKNTFNGGITWGF